MIRHILKIIWNERKTNGWILIEYTFVFCVLWFCCDYLYYMGRIYLEPSGFDIENTYVLKLQRSTGNTKENYDEYVLTNQVLERLNRHPEIESASLSNAAIPYSGWKSETGGLTVYPDSFMIHSIQERRVTPSFFDVFKIKPLTGRMPDPYKAQKEILISAGWQNGFGDYNDAPYPAEKVTFLGSNPDNPEEGRTVTGTIPRIKNRFFEPYKTNILNVEPDGNIPLNQTDLTIRIKPQVEAKGFEQRFLEEMREQLSVGPYILTSVTSLEEMKTNAIYSFGIADQLNNVYAITAFLIINIFLGIIGTFWYRIQSRRNEIGLRIAMGATRKNICHMLFSETLLLLFIASFIATNICMQLGQTDLLVTLGLPMADHVHTLSGPEQYLINYLLTTIFLAMVSLLAVWYPARKASVIQPADALRSE